MSSTNQILLLDSEPYSTNLNLLSEYDEVYKLKDSTILLGKNKIVGLSDDEKKNINYNTLKFVNGFGHKTINEKSFIQSLEIEKGRSLWWCHRFRAYFDLRNFMYDFNLVEKFLLLNPDVKLITVFHSKYEKFKIMGISVDLIKSEEKSIAKIDLIILFRIILSVFTRWVISLNQAKMLKRSYWIFEKTGFEQIIFTSKNRYNKGHPYTEYLLNDDRGKLAVITELIVDSIWKKKVKLKPLKFIKKQRKPEIFSEGLLGLNSIQFFSFKKAKKQINSLWKSNHAWKTNTINKERLLVHLFESYKNSSTIYQMRYSALKFKMRKYMSTLKSVIVVDEYSPINRSIVDAAKSLGIKTYALQHGSIHPLHPGYVFHKNDHLYNPWVDHIFIWGDYWKEILISQGYPENRLLVVGQIRTDIIPDLLSLKQNKNSTETTITFASQPQRDSVLRKMVLVDLAEICKKIDLKLTLKPHPAETEDDFFTTVFKEVGFTNYKIERGEDLYYMISNSDVLVTSFSTVGAEAAYFKVPVITIDYLDQDVAGFAKEGIAYQAKSKRELEQAIVEINKGRSIVSSENLDLFTKKSAFKIDGKVTDRIWEKLSP